MQEINVALLPAAIYHLIFSIQVETVRHQDRPNWIERLFPKVYPIGNRVAEVRQFSECDVNHRTCSGTVIGWWLVHTNGIKVLDKSILSSLIAGDVKSEPHQRMAIDDPFFFRVFNVAVSPDKAMFVLNQIDVDGQLVQSVYEFIDAECRLIQPSIKHSYERSRWDICDPQIWRHPRMGEEKKL